VDTLVVDKTGTLTEGKPRLVTILAEGIAEDELLGLAASLERASEHPLAAAVVAAAAERRLQLHDVSEFRSVTGKGVHGLAGGKRVALGNRELLGELGIESGRLADRAQALRSDGQTVVFVAIDGVVAALLGVADPIKPSTEEAMTHLHRAGLRVV